MWNFFVVILIFKLKLLYWDYTKFFQSGFILLAGNYVLLANIYIILSLTPRLESLLNTQTISISKNSWRASEKIPIILGTSDFKLLANNSQCLLSAYSDVQPEDHYTNFVHPIFDSTQASAITRYCRHIAKFPVWVDTTPQSI